MSYFTSQVKELKWDEIKMVTKNEQKALNET